MVERVTDSFVGKHPPDPVKHFAVDLRKLMLKPVQNVEYKS